MLTVSTQIAIEDNLASFTKMLDSVSFADEILLYTMYEPGLKLKKIIKKYELKPIKVKTPIPKVVEGIRGVQVSDASSDWVLIMDFDEVVPKELKKEILSIIKKSDSSAAYAIKRKNFSLGKPLKRGGWGDDYIVRLVHKPRFITWPKQIHSKPEVSGKITKTINFMNHYKDESLAFIIAKTNRYSDVESAQYLKGGLAPVTSITLLRKMNMEVFRRGLLRRGILDGDIGIIQSIYQGFSVFVSYAKLYEKQQKK